jgi:hypothetical protein
MRGGARVVSLRIRFRKVERRIDRLISRSGGTVDEPQDVSLTEYTEYTEYYGPMRRHTHVLSAHFVKGLSSEPVDHGAGT